MFCPKCGQQQSPEQIRFCSRCGFKLSVIRDLLHTDGAIKAGKAESALPTLVSLIMLIAALLAVGASLIYVGPASHQMVMFSLIGTAISLVFLLSSRPWRFSLRLFSRDTEPVKQVDSTAPEYALPPTQSIPPTDFGTQVVRTQPSSVTEHTTRLLEPEEIE